MAQGRAAAQKIAFFGLGFVSIVLVIAVVLNLAYPLSHEIELKRYPKTMWVVGYAISVFVLSAFVFVNAAICSRRLHHKPSLASFIAAITTASILVIYCIAVVKTFPSQLGLGIIDIMNAKFLAEWQFLSFIGVIAPVCATLSAALTWIISRKLRNRVGPR